MSEKCCDLSEMSEEELNALRDRVITEIDSRYVDEAEEYLGTEDGKELMKEWKALNKASNAFTKAQEFEVNIPVTFKVDVDFNDGLAYLIDGYDKPAVSDIFGVGVTGKIKGKPFDKDLLCHMQDHLDGICGELCSEVLRLNPEGYAAMVKFAKTLEKFKNRLAKTPVTAEDLEHQE